ncbi:MAG: hypothetical protein JSR59_24005 [Proteobacteria bacterium]|nr:hypothetical protein [Pseudomonadota bacterium]
MSSCCNGRRAAALAGPAGAWVEFQYVGAQAMTVFGTHTRIRYRFPGPGARIAVDPRDAAGIEGVPHVRRVPRPLPGRSG